MGFFAPTPRVTGEEWKRVRARLLERGLSRRDVNDVETIAERALTESGKGIDKWEVRDIVSYLRNHRARHSLTDEQIARVQNALEDKL